MTRRRFEGLYDRSSATRARLRLVPTKTVVPGKVTVPLSTKKPKKDKDKGEKK